MSNSTQFTQQAGNVQLQSQAGGDPANTLLTRARDAVIHFVHTHSGTLASASFVGGAVSALRGNGIRNRCNILAAGLAAYTLYKNLSDTSAAGSAGKSNSPALPLASSNNQPAKAVNSRGSNSAQHAQRQSVVHNRNMRATGSTVKSSSPALPLASSNNRSEKAVNSRGSNSAQHAQRSGVVHNQSGLDSSIPESLKRAAESLWNIGALSSNTPETYRESMATLIQMRANLKDVAERVANPFYKNLINDCKKRSGSLGFQSLGDRYLAMLYINDVVKILKGSSPDFKKARRTLQAICIPKLQDKAAIERMEKGSIKATFESSISSLIAISKKLEETDKKTLIKRLEFINTTIKSVIPGYNQASKNLVYLGNDLNKIANLMVKAPQARNLREAQQSTSLQKQ